MIKGDIIPVQSDLDRFLIQFWMLGAQRILERTIFSIDARLDADAEQQWPVFDPEIREKLAKSLERFRYEIATDILDEQKEFITLLLQQIHKKEAKKIQKKHVEECKKQVSTLKTALNHVKMSA